MVIEEKIKTLGERFRGRIIPWRLDGVLEYVDFNENRLAFELLCSEIYEYDIEISKEEYDEIIALVIELNVDLENCDIQGLKFLIRK